jgi:hypothetical protein
MEEYIIWIIAFTITVVALIIFHYYTYKSGGSCKNEEDKRETIIL